MNKLYLLTFVVVKLVVGEKKEKKQQQNVFVFEAQFRIRALSPTISENQFNLFCMLKRYVIMNINNVCSKIQYFFSSLSLKVTSLLNGIFLL